MNFSKYFDHTVLSPKTTPAMLKAVCGEARKYGFCSVAVNTGMVSLCREYLAGSDVKVDAAVGFPLGITTVETKLYEAADAIRNGADEVDYVVNVGMVKNGDRSYIEREMEALTKLCRGHGVLSKVIFENCYLTDDEKRMLCRVALTVGPDFIKTSTGFGTGGATPDDVRLMKEEVGNAIHIKAAGGIRDLAGCLELIDAGAVRIGCSSSVSITEEYARLRTGMAERHDII